MIAVLNLLSLIILRILSAISICNCYLQFGPNSELLSLDMTV